MLCQYKFIFGKTNEGFHKIRVLGFAAFDIIATVLVGALIAYIFGLSYIKIIGYLFLLSIILHWLFCVDTAFMKMMGNVFGKLRK
jgi:hypothetical protein